MIIMEGLKTLLFGMTGIFIVMGVIVLITVLLRRMGKKENDGGDE